VSETIFDQIFFCSITPSAETQSSSASLINENTNEKHSSWIGTMTEQIGPKINLMLWSIAAYK